MTDQIYRWILIILAVDIAFGALLVFFVPNLRGLGTGIVLACGAIYLFFRLWGRNRFK